MTKFPSEDAAVDAATATIIDWEKRHLTQDQQVQALALVAGWIRLSIDTVEHAT